MPGPTIIEHHRKVFSGLIGGGLPFLTILKRVWKKDKEGRQISEKVDFVWHGRHPRDICLTWQLMVIASSEIQVRRYLTRSIYSHHSEGSFDIEIAAFAAGSHRVFCPSASSCLMPIPEELEVEERKSLRLTNLRFAMFFSIFCGDQKCASHWAYFFSLLSVISSCNFCYCQEPRMRDAPQSFEILRRLHDLKMNIGLTFLKANTVRLSE